MTSSRYEHVNVEGINYQFQKARAAKAEAENSVLRLWIDSEGRNCPSNDTIDAFLLGLDDPDA